MSKIIFFKEQINKILVSHFFIAFIAFIFILTIIAFAMGKLGRWDLLEQVSMVDNYFNEGFFYPAFNDPNPHGTSAYFPGLALFLSLFRGAGIDFYLVEFSIAISCLVLLAFMYVQLKISEKIIDKSISYYKFIPFIISYCLILTPTWLMYAIEFKPDTVALLFGYLGLSICAFLDDSSSIKKILIGSLFCAGALIFKQQYIAFIFGISFYCLFFPSRNRLLFLFLIAVFTSLILIIFYKNSDIWFWNVLVLADDPFLSIKEIAELNFRAIQVLIFSIICCITFLKLNEKNSPINLDTGMIQRLYKMPWAWGATFFILASFASALKVGGNSGNTELGIFLVLPLIYAILSNLPTRIFTALAAAALIMDVPNVAYGVVKFNLANELRSFVVSEEENIPFTVLTGSNVYFASRHYNYNNESFNYWTAAKRDNKDLINLGLLLPNIPPDRLVVENWPNNKKAILLDNRYIIIFENQLGIVAKKVQ